jgi:hypothetical protein
MVMVSDFLDSRSFNVVGGASDFKAARLLRWSVACATVIGIAVFIYPEGGGEGVPQKGIVRIFPPVASRTAIVSGSSMVGNDDLAAQVPHPIDYTFIDSSAIPSMGDAIVVPASGYQLVPSEGGAMVARSTALNSNRGTEPGVFVALADGTLAASPAHTVAAATGQIIEDRDTQLTNGGKPGNALPLTRSSD